MELKEAVTILKNIDVSDLRELCDVTEETYDEAICVVLDKLEEYSKQLDLDYVDENYISKDKIKEKIEKLENEIKEMQYNDRHKHEVFIYLHDIDVLEELLKGE